jgi:hypothetical protein
MGKARSSYWSAGAAGPVLGYEEGGWQDDSACRRADPELFFPQLGENAAEAKRICARCPVRSECLSYAMGRPDLQGVWGGLTDEERRDVRAGRPLRPVRAAASTKATAYAQALPELSDDVVARFRSYLRNGGCGVTWAGPVLASNGAALFMFSAGGRRWNVLARRIALKLAGGHEPSGSSKVPGPRCGRQLCVTPACLTEDAAGLKALTPLPRAGAQTVPDLTDAEIALFWSKTRHGGCGVEWAQSLARDSRRKTGTALFRVTTKSPRVAARRLAYKLATGRDPGSLEVIQQCGNPRCLTPGCLAAAPRSGGTRPDARPSRPRRAAA